MSKSSSMQFVLIVMIILCAACKKNNPITKSTFTPSTTPPTVAPIPAPEVIVPSLEIGTGSGSLAIDGKSLNLSNTKLIKIKAGSYTNITISNISGTAAQPIAIKNNGLVIITGSLSTDNVNYLTIAGDNVSSIPYGFNFNNIAYRAIMLHGRVSGVILKNLSFKNISDYSISGDQNNGSSFKYTGTAETRNDTFKILNCSFDNAGPIAFGGNLDKTTGEDTGFFKDVEIAYNTFQNTNSGTVCSMTNVQDYNIHHNTVNNINQTNNNHNGVFFMYGNGKFHDNTLTNYQGNSIRMWLYSRGSTPATNEIYNNICYNTRKYGGFEIQGFDKNIIAGKSTFANAKVYNNTVGKMNTNKDWEGQILDVYNYGGTLEFYNNLGFDLFSSSKTVTTMINNMSDTKIIKDDNNKYLAQASSAIQDLNSFISIFPGIGAK